MNFADLCEDVRRRYAGCVLKTARADRLASRERFRSDDCVVKLLSSSKLSDRLHPAVVQLMDELTDDWLPEQTATAFDAMETYAVNLVEYPWKKEFHTILVNFAAILPLFGSTCLAVCLSTESLRNCEQISVTPRAS